MPDAGLYISSITVMEARKGFARLRAKAGSAADARRVQGYAREFDELLRTFEGRILAVDRAVAECWGDMLGQREANVMDAAVAATAAVHGLVVATRNLRHFRDRGVRLLDPFKASPTVEAPVDP